MYLPDDLWLYIKTNFLIPKKNYNFSNYKLMYFYLKNKSIY